MIQEPHDDAELTAEQRFLVDRLSEGDLATVDHALLALIGERWRKVAFVIGKAMQNLGDKPTPGLPDVFFAERVRLMAQQGLIESVGNLRRMRFSEVRRPNREPE